MEYEANPKHKPLPTPGRRGSTCPRNVDAARLLGGSILAGQKRYATDGESAFCAQCHDDERDLWHGYPVNWSEVPPTIVNDWISQATVSRRIARRTRRRPR